MIIVSGLRPGLVIGLSVTPLKIQHDGSRWNSRFGSGGSSMDVGLADSHTRPRSSATSARVIPPIRNSVTSSASDASAHSRARSAAAIPTSSSFRMWSLTQSLASGLASASASNCSTWKTSTPRSRITSTNMSCSALARATQITSSNSSSSALDGVRRLCSRPGRCTITRRSLPTSEWTPSVMLITSFSWVLGLSAGLDGRPGYEFLAFAGGGLALARQLDGLVHSDERRRDEREREHDHPLPSAERHGVEQALQHAELYGGPGEDPAEDDPAQEGEHWRRPRRLALAPHDQADVDRAERDDGERHRHGGRRMRGARLVRPPLEHREGGDRDHEPGDDPSDDLRPVDDLGPGLAWWPLHNPWVGHVDDEPDDYGDDD